MGSSHDGEVLNAARRINEMIRVAGARWDDLIVVPDLPKADNTGDLRRLDDLLASDKVADVLKFRLSAMRISLQAALLAESDRRLLRILHRKGIIDGAIIEK